mgnify:CR=1 FL=1
MISLWPLVPILLAAAPVEPPVMRHVLIVTASADPDGENPPLRFSDDDGARFFDLFSAFGARVEILTTMDEETQRLFPELVGRTRAPTRERLDTALAATFAAIRQDRTEGLPTEFIFIYSGHGKVEGGLGRLALADGYLSREELFRRVIAASPADYNHIIIDACHAYFMVMPKGPWRDDAGPAAALRALGAFLEEPELALHPTTGMLLSTAGTGEVHEWERLRAGVFSHELRTGLLGPADVDGDGAITYGELDAFVTAANVGVSNPRARIDLFARAPRQNLRHPLLVIGSGGKKDLVRFPEDSSGRIEVEDERGSYAMWNKAPDHASYLALLRRPSFSETRYWLRRGDREMSVTLAAPDGARQETAFDERRLEASGAAPRSSVEESFRRELFAVPFGREFFRGFGAARAVRGEAELSPSHPEAFRHRLFAAYAVKTAPISGDGAAHGARLIYRYHLSDRFFLETRAGYARSEGGQEANSHATDDFEVGLGGGVSFAPLENLALSIAGTAGNHWYRNRLLKVPASDNERVHRDDFGPYLGLSTSAGLQLWNRMQLALSAGLSVVFAAPERKEETLWIPEGMLVLGIML